MERAAAEWRYDSLHEDAPYHDGTFPTNPDRWSVKRTADFPYHYRDGVTLWVAEADLSPHDHFLGGAGECEVCSVASGDGPDAEREQREGDSPRPEGEG